MSRAYRNSVAAAQARDANDTKGSWRLADAILEDIPDGGAGGRPAQETNRPEAVSFRPVPERLADLADQLEADGIRTPNGDPYTKQSLRDLRQMAQQWPKDGRYPEAAYRTHREAGSSVRGKKVLHQLVRVARGETARRPTDVENAEAWAEAVERVRDRQKGYRVTANDIRIALSRKPNVPKPDAEEEDKPSGDEVKAALRRPVEIMSEVSGLPEAEIQQKHAKALGAITQQLGIEDPGDVEAWLHAAAEEWDEIRLNEIAKEEANKEAEAKKTAEEKEAEERRARAFACVKKAGALRQAAVELHEALRNGEFVVWEETKLVRDDIEAAQFEMIAALLLIDGIEVQA